MKRVGKYAGRRSMAAAFHVSTAIAGLFALPGAAWAGCAPNPTEPDQTTICSGLETTVLAVETNGANVVISQDALLSAGSDHAIRVAPPMPSALQSTIAIDGTAISASNSAILVATGPMGSNSHGYLNRVTVTVGETGAVTGATGIEVRGAQNYYGRTELTLVNGGTISSSTGGYALSGSSDVSGRFASVTCRRASSAPSAARSAPSTTRALSMAARAAPSSTRRDPCNITGRAPSSTAARCGRADATLYFYRNYNPNPYVENHGLIVNEGTGAAIEGQSRLTILNGADGTIRSNAIAILAPTMGVTNEGTITGAGGALVTDRSLSLTNRGTINGDVVSTGGNYYAGSLIDNVGGTINGDVRLGDSDDVFIGDAANFASPIGAINGTLDAGGGTDAVRFTFKADTVLDSDIPLPHTIEQLQLWIGNSSTLTLSESFATSSALSIGGGDESFYNPQNRFINNGAITAQGPALVSSGTGGISVENNGTISATLANAIDYAVNLHSISAFENSGTISAAGGKGVRGVYGFGNSGTIIADDTAVESDGSFDNSGSVVSRQGVGVDLKGNYQGGSVNSGTIEGASAGVRLYYATLNNSGTITSPRAGIEIGIAGQLNNLAGGIVNGGIAPSSTGYGAQGARITNAGVINGDVDFGTPDYAQQTSNIFVALPGGTVNGNVHLGGGNDVFATSLVNTGPGEFAGITGTVSGGGRETLRYIVDTNASVTPELRGIFSALAYDLSNDATLQLSSAAPLSFGIGFSGTGTVDLTADMSGGNGPTPVLDLTQVSVQSAADGTPVPTKLEITSRGTITLVHDDVQSYGSPAAAVGAGSNFTNAGTIVARDRVAGNNPYRQSMAAISATSGRIVNSGTISLDGAVGISADYYGGVEPTEIINSGIIAQIAGGNLSTGLITRGDVTNSGQILTGGTAVQLLYGRLFNSGTIASGGATAVSSSSFSGGLIVNDTHGTISGGTGFDAVSLGLGGKLSNAGTINGNVVLASQPYSYTRAIYINRGGMLNGDLTLGFGDDLLVSLDGETGVAGAISAGEGTDTFVRALSTSTSVDLGNAASTPAGFERQGLGALGEDTVVTLTAGAGGVDAPLLLVGDGSIVNLASINAAGVQDPANIVTLGIPDDPGGLLGIGSRLAFTNRATLGDGITGDARSFANEGTIGVRELSASAVNIFANDARGFTFRNSGTIVAESAAPGSYYSYGDARTTIGQAIAAVDRMTIDNNGTIGGGMAVTARINRFDWSNSGMITPADGYKSGVYLTVGQPPIYTTLGYNADHAAIANSGTIEGGLMAMISAKVLDFRNSGTIGAARYGTSVHLEQTALWTVDEATGAYDAIEQERASFANSGTIAGTVALSAAAQVIDVANSGDISVGGRRSSIDATGSSFDIYGRSESSQTVSLVNSGRIEAASPANRAVRIASIAVPAAEQEGGMDVSLPPVAGGVTTTVTVTNSGTIRADGGGVYLPGGCTYYPGGPITPDPAPCYVITPEMVAVASALAIDAESSGASTVAVVNEASGIISATGTIDTTGLADALAASLATTGSTAITVRADRVSVDNAGAIQGLAGGVVPREFTFDDVFDAPGGSPYVAGAIRTFQSIDTVTNRATGVIVGSIDLGAMDDVLVNAGTIRGDVFLGDGSDAMVHNIGGMLTGGIDGGAGTDSLVIDITGGGVLSQALLSRFVDFESQVISGTGTITTEGPFAQDSLILRDANLTLAAGQTIETGSGTAIVFAGGTNSIVNLGTIKGAIDLSTGTNSLFNQGRISGAVRFGSGDDHLVLGSGAVLDGPVDGGGGNDLLILSAPGTGTTPVEMTLSTVTGFERTRHESGVIALSGTFSTGSLDILGGRLFGRAGSTISAPTIVVARGATFGSAGTVVGDIAVAGTLSPGASPGTMTVDGNVFLAAGSTSLFEFTPTVSDQLLVSGTLSIAPGATLTLTGARPLTPGVTLDLIVAEGGITGGFATIDKVATVHGFLRQSAKKLSLLGTFGTHPGFAPQVNATIGYVNDVFITGQGSPALIAAAPSLLTAAGTSNAVAFRQLSPEAYASASQLGTEQGLTVVEAARSQLRTAPNADGLFTFGQMLGNRRSLGGDAGQGTSGATLQSHGGLAGFGMGNEEGWAGAFVGYLSGRQTIGGLGVQTEAEGVISGVQAQLTRGGISLDALLAYSGGHVDTRRPVPGATLSGRYALRSAISDIRLSYSMEVNGSWAVEPAAGMTAIRTTRGAVAENGASPFALRVEESRTTRLFVDGALTLVGGKAPEDRFHPFLSAGVRRQLDNRGSVATAGFAGVTTRFTLPGVTRERTLATAGAGLSFDATDRLGLFATYAGEFADDARHNASVGLRLKM